jgi:putative oxidoreductase
MINFYFSPDWGLLLVRLVLGVVMLSHGWPKFRNLKENAEKFREMGFHPGFFWGTIVAVAEFIGGFGVILGIWASVIAMFLALDMIVAVIWKLFKWHQPLKDCEFEFALLALSVLLFSVGSGAYSILPFPYIY